MENLKEQIEFLREIDKLYLIKRKSFHIDSEENENTVEHSWHGAIIANIFSEYFPQEANKERIIKMILIHDIVEIDAGDVIAFDKKARKLAEEKEENAAERIFNILPKKQSEEYITLWKEFQEKTTIESKIANSIDIIQPLILNFYNSGKVWIKHKIKKEQVIERLAPIKESSQRLWEYSNSLIEQATKNGWLKNA